MRVLLPEAPFVQEQVEILSSADAEVEAALAAHPAGLLQLGTVEDLAALVALEPQPALHVLLVGSRLDALLAALEPAHRPRPFSREPAVVRAASKRSSTAASRRASVPSRDFMTSITSR